MRRTLARLLLSALLVFGQMAPEMVYAQTTDIVATGSLTGSTQAVTASVSNHPGVAFNVSGTWVATLNAQVTVDNVTWTTVNSTNVNTGTSAANVTANGSYVIGYTAGMLNARIYATAYTSGTAAVVLRTTQAPSTVTSGGSGSGGDASAANQTAVQGTDGGTVASKVEVVGGFNVTATTQHALLVDADGTLRTNDVAANNTLTSINSNTAAAAQTDTGSSSPTITQGGSIFGTYQSTTTNLTSGTYGFVRQSANRSLNVNIRDNAGNERGLNVDASGNIGVNTVGAVTAITNALPTGTNTLGSVKMLYSNGDPVASTDVASTNITQVGTTAVVACATAGCLTVGGFQVFTPTENVPGPARTIGQVVQAIVDTSGVIYVRQADCGDPGMVSSVAISTAGIGEFQLVSLTSQERIIVCGWDVVANGTTNVNLDYGTGTNCATGNTVLTGAYPLTAQVGIVRGNAGSPQTVLPLSQALCIKNSAAIQISGMLTYVKRK